jgi:hypothetical protein
MHDEPAPLTVLKDGKPEPFDAHDAQRHFDLVPFSDLLSEREDLGERMDRLKEVYWRRCMAQRGDRRDEVSRLVTALYGFYAQQSQEASDYEPTLLGFLKGKRPWGNKNVAASIAFTLGWDTGGLLSRDDRLPDFVEHEASVLFTEVLKAIMNTGPSLVEVLLRQVEAQTKRLSYCHDMMYDLFNAPDNDASFGGELVGRYLDEYTKPVAPPTEEEIAEAIARKERDR